MDKLLIHANAATTRDCTLSIPSHVVRIHSGARQNNRQSHRRPESEFASHPPLDPVSAASICSTWASFSLHNTLTHCLIRPRKATSSS